MSAILTCRLIRAKPTLSGGLGGLSLAEVLLLGDGGGDSREMRV